MMSQIVAHSSSDTVNLERLPMLGLWQLLRWHAYCNAMQCNAMRCDAMHEGPELYHGPGLSGPVIRMLSVEMLSTLMAGCYATST